MKKIPLDTWLKPSPVAQPPRLLCLFTDEPLFLSQGADLYRTRLRQSTPHQRQVIEADRGFNAQAFLALFSEVSLFGDVTLADLRLSQPKLNKEVAQAIEQVTAWIAKGQSDHFLLITGPKLNRTQEKSAGFAQALEHGTEIVCKPITPDNLPQWIGTTAKRLGLALDQTSCNWLAERTEGNLLAAHQTLEKLAVEFAHLSSRASHPGASAPTQATTTAIAPPTAHPITLEQVRQTASDCARFNVFDLGPNVLAGDHKRTLRMLDGLKAEGETPVLVLWALQEELRAIHHTRMALRKGLSLPEACQQARIWGARQQHIHTAIKRHNAESLSALTRWCYLAEKTIKGLYKSDPWPLLELISLGIGGISPPPFGLNEY